MSRHNVRVAIRVAALLACVSLPLHAGPILSSTPESGGYLFMAGQPATVAQASVSLANIGTSSLQLNGCATQAPFSLPQSSFTLAAGQSSLMLVDCDVGSFFQEGLVTCNSNEPERPTVSYAIYCENLLGPSLIFSNGGE